MKAGSDVTSFDMLSYVFEFKCCFPWMRVGPQTGLFLDPQWGYFLISAPFTSAGSLLEFIPPFALSILGETGPGRTGDAAWISTASVLIPSVPSGGMLWFLIAAPPNPRWAFGQLEPVGSGPL